MSGVMLKTAIYGIIRVTFDLLKVSLVVGAIVLILGLISAVMGVLFALMQNDLKRLLAYSSVENIGIILIGIGASMIFASFQMPLLAALGLIAGLYHTMNHAMFKGRRRVCASAWNETWRWAGLSPYEMDRTVFSSAASPSRAASF
jgi:formate hydrogenlyase subunit 3/multisubunit Na+/H+ antiporter MnhD subunit